MEVSGKMPVPKSVTRVTKDGVKIISNVDKAQYFMFELCRAALRDSGKIVARRFRDKYYNHFKKHTGSGGKSIKYKVWSNVNTIQPRLQIGIPHAHRGKKVKGFYAYFHEMGTSKTPALGFLRKSVEENIAEIVNAQSQYLSALEDEARALSLIDENEMEGGEDE